ncbi:uncharacterized protein LOC133830988 isoform X2 [Humulus lupulus]|uniref:uncharacterized protein LOC133830988 isoform X2 n=1 Tax=Humulus lupulus TaxID=3486 RepID=UPI002B40171F|nr:uncharacterized protein LOC133830988 isoform X2 [Humulus lupulus]
MPPGNRLVQNPRNFPKLASDSSSCSSGIADDDSFTFELGLRSSKQAAGTPIKNLLAKEMSKETESRRRPPNVVARLMGLDGLPPQKPAYREENVISDGFLRTVRTVEKSQRSSRRYDTRSSRKSSKDEQEFKDVFEVLETSKVGSCSYPSQQGMANSNLTDAEMAFIRQKFMDAKRLSTDEKLQGSKEFHEALEVLDSNKDLLLKFLQQPDSLFTKHLQDLQGATPQPLCGRIAATKSSNAQLYEKIHLDSKSAREPFHKNRSALPQRHRDRLTKHSDFHVAQNSLNSSKNQLKGKEEPAILPTRIVVLKPNLGKVLNADNTVSSPCSSHASLPECRNDAEIQIIKSREVELLGGRNFRHDVGISGHKSRESRELAKQITRQIKNNCSNSSVKLSSSTLKGYAGDESSCSMSGNESANESETMSTSSKYSFDLSKRSRSLSSRSTESSVSREAKKRLSERWKLTHKSLDMAVVSRGSTLADMLAIPDKETRPVYLDSITDEEGSRNKIVCDDEPARWVEPLGISSRDGWKDGCISNLTRSRSLPSSSTVFGSPRAITGREPVCDDRYVIPKEALKRERVKAQKIKTDKKSINRNSGSSGKRSHLSHSIRESKDSSIKTLASQNHVNNKLDVNGRQPQQKIEDIESLTDNLIDDRNPVSILPLDGEHKTTMSSELLNNSLQESSAQSMLADICHAGDRNDINLQEPMMEPHEQSPIPSKHSVPGLESPANSKDAEQPSPVSILEVPFTDDVSSCSECFESLSADLQGLRMQLQLLKLESESYEEGPMLVSSDDEDGEGAEVLDAFGLSGSQQSWESCYVADVLIHSGLKEADADTFLAAWHTRDCPLSPFLLEELEKKYNNETSPPKSERKLLFDRISCGILEMYKPIADPHPWIRSSTTRLGSRWSKNELENGVCLWLPKQAKNVKKEIAEKVMGRESEWLDMGDDIDIIGREMETLLLEELVEELLVAM